MAINRFKKDLLRVGAAFLMMTMLVTACSDKSSKRKHRDRDDDEEETEVEETEETSEETMETETEPVETTAAGPTEEDIDQAYVSVLDSYSSKIKLFENSYNSYSGTTPSINYIDINGDGINELIFKYVSDDDHTDMDLSYFDHPVFANIAIYSYNSSTNSADCLLDVEVESRTGSWDGTCDVCMLDNGNILIPNMNGRMGYYTQSMTEYQFDGTKYDEINNWMVYEEIPEDVMTSGSDEYTYESTDAWCNEETVSPDDFYAAQQDYVSRLSIPLMPNSTRFFEDGYNMTDLFGRDWCSIPGSFFTSGNYIFCKDLLSQIDPDYATKAAAETERNSAYIEILNEYEEAMRILENTQYSPVISCSYLDITGDGAPELVIQYSSDEEKTGSFYSDYFLCADMRFFTYDASSKQVVEMLHVEHTILNAGGGFNADAILLDNGNIIITTGWGDENCEISYTEYQVKGNELVKVNDLFYGYYLSYEDSDDYTEEYVYKYNDQAISEDEFNAYKDGYADSFNTVIFKDTFYDSDWMEPTSWITAVLECPSAETWYDNLYFLLSN